MWTQWTIEREWTIEWTIGRSQGGEQETLGNHKAIGWKQTVGGLGIGTEVSPQNKTIGTINRGLQTETTWGPGRTREIEWRQTGTTQKLLWIRKGKTRKEITWR